MSWNVYHKFSECLYSPVLFNTFIMQVICHMGSYLFFTLKNSCKQKRTEKKIIRNHGTQINILVNGNILPYLFCMFIYLSDYTKVSVLSLRD